MNPAVPVTPKEICDVLEKCCKLGVSVAHLHARDENGKPTHSRAAYQAILDEIKRRKIRNRHDFHSFGVFHAADACCHHGRCDTEHIGDLLVTCPSILFENVNNSSVQIGKLKTGICHNSAYLRIHTHLTIHVIL